MWQRFTERARRVVFFAQEEAAQLGENYVGTEHLLLGLVRESDSVAAKILDFMGIPLGRIRSDIERQVTRGHGNLGQDMQLTPRAKRIIDLAYEEARQLNNNYIGTEHMLLGMVREGDGLAARVLVKLGADLERTRGVVVEWQEANPPGTATPHPPSGHRDILLRDLNWVLYYAGGTVGADGRTWVEPEDLLLRIVEDTANNAAQILAKLGVDAAAVRAVLQRPAPSAAAGRPRNTLLTPRTKQVLAIAFAEFAASDRGNPGSEYLLAGILREGELNESPAASALSGLGVDLEKVQSEIARLEVSPAGSVWHPTTLLEQTLAAYRRPGLSEAGIEKMKRADAEAAVSRAEDLTRAAGRWTVRGEDLLLGILEVPDGVGAEALARLGVDPAVVREKLARALAAPEPGPEPAQVTLSAIVRQVIYDAVTVYLVQAHSELDSSHLLLVLLAPWTGRPAQVLGELGVTPVRLLEALAADGEGAAAPPETEN